MKRYAKSLKEYENIEFDEKKLVAIAKRLKKGIPYQILMRMFILEGLSKIKRSLGET